MITPIPYKKVVRDGKVALVISSGFGVGWSTWGSAPWTDFMLFDERVVALVEAGADPEAVKKLFIEVGTENGIENAEDHLPCLLGWIDGITVVWLEEGTTFYIHDYDGAESVKTGSDLYRSA